jgi:predicted lipid-binding transport protein (Tim44 family)
MSAVCTRVRSHPGDAGALGRIDVKRILSVTAALLTAFAMVGADTVDAKRLGGGRSLGAQRQSVAPPPSPSAPAAAPNAGPAGAASNPVMPPGAATARSAPTAAAPAAAAAAGAARTGMSRWMGPLAGIAAGLGLAWLAHSLGFSEALLSALLIGLAIVAVIIVARMLLARRAGARPAPYAGAAAGNVNARTGFEPAASREAPRFEPTFGSTPPVDASRGRYPPGFDAPAFLEQARKQFTRLQVAYDAGDRAFLSDVMTPELFADVASDLDGRVSHVPTEVVALNPEIVEVTTEGNEHWASVRFRGLLREDGSPMPKPFDELWNLVKPADGSSGWLLAGIRQLDESPVGHA